MDFFQKLNAHISIDRELPARVREPLGGVHTSLPEAHENPNGLVYQ